MITIEQKMLYAQMISEVLFPDFKLSPTPFDYPDELVNTHRLYFRFTGKTTAIQNKDKLLNKITSVSDEVCISAEVMHIRGFGKYVVAEIHTLEDLEKEKQILQDKYAQDMQLIDEKIRKIRVT